MAKNDSISYKPNNKIIAIALSWKEMLDYDFGNPMPILLGDFSCYDYSTDYLDNMTKQALDKFALVFWIGRRNLKTCDNKQVNNLILSWCLGESNQNIIQKTNQNIKQTVLINTNIPSVTPRGTMMETKYPSVQSQKQFKYILKHRDIRIRLSQFIRNSQEWELIKNLVKQNKQDGQIYSALHRKFLESKNINNSDSQDRAQNRIKKISNILRTLQVTNYLDYGCGDGSITQEIGKFYDLDKNNIFCVDVRQPKKHSNYQFDLLQNNKIPHENNKFDLITSFVVLHHVKNVELIIKELYRVTKQNGIIIIREHDCNTNNLRVFLDIVHGLWSLVKSDPQEDPNFIQEYEAYYKSQETLTNMLEAVGFYRVMSEDANRLYNEAEINNKNNKKNIQRLYTAIYRKN